MRSPSSVITASALALVLSVGVITASYRLGADSQPSPITSFGADQAGAGEATAITELFERIRTEAVDAPSADALVEGAIEGMLGTLDDPYAEYYDPAAFAAFNQSLDSSLSGVGLLLEETPEGPTVVRALPDTPAEAAGIETGERIVTVDGRDVGELPLTAIVQLVTGAEGTQVTLGFEGGSQGPRTVELTRATFEVPTLDAELLDDGAGLIQLMNFRENAAEQLRAAVQELLDQDATGIILDVRGNPGGLLNEAVEVVSVFVQDEVVVTVRLPSGQNRVERAGTDGLVDVALVVLADEGSASASEIVAGALQDLDRAEVVGQPTFGKGTVQTVRPLSAGGGIKFTTAEYFTPSGDSIEGTGVQPDTLADADEQVAAAQAALRRSIARIAVR
jgi:carboxyl-terminal processing protease